MSKTTICFGLRLRSCSKIIKFIDRLNEEVNKPFSTHCSNLVLHYASAHDVIQSWRSLRRNAPPFGRWQSLLVLVCAVARMTYSPVECVQQRMNDVLALGGFHKTLLRHDYWYAVYLVKNEKKILVMIRLHLNKQTNKQRQKWKKFWPTKKSL